MTTITRIEPRQSKCFRTIIEEAKRAISQELEDRAAQEAIEGHYQRQGVARQFKGKGI